jgi:hypothetical protein
MQRLAEWLFLALGLICFAILAIHFWRFRAAGPILLDIRSHNSSHLGFGIVALLAGLFFVFFTEFRFMGVYWLGYGALMVVAGLPRFQIREAGVFTRKLFRWEDLEEFYLGRKGDLGLKLRGKGWTGVGEVPRESRQRLNEVLSARLAAQHVIDGF